jgi:hypothetical protein
MKCEAIHCFDLGTVRRATTGHGSSQTYRRTPCAMSGEPDTLNACSSLKRSLRTCAVDGLHGPFKSRSLIASVSLSLSP